MSYLFREKAESFALNAKNRPHKDCFRLADSMKPEAGLPDEAVELARIGGFRSETRYAPKKESLECGLEDSHRFGAPYRPLRLARRFEVHEHRCVRVTKDCAVRRT